MITVLLADLEPSSYLPLFLMILSACLLALSAGSRSGVNTLRLERELALVQQKLDLLLKHAGIEAPTPLSGMSPEVRRLASSPATKIAAIKLYREENPGVGLAEAKTAIEMFAEGRR